MLLKPKDILEVEKQIFNCHQIEMIKALSYFDVFNYPLTGDELYENSAVHISKEEFELELKSLFERNVLKQEGEFVLNNAAGKEEILKRLEGNKGAKAIMPVALKYSKKIAKFPFVEGLCLSGGISKNYYDANSDIDFFIITKPNRLWICRTLLILRYKFLPKHKKKYWCTNYFISSDDMVIPDHNAFTSTELAYLIPTINYKVYKELLSQNSWYKQKFPNKAEASNANCFEPKDGFLKRTIEKTLNGNFGTWIENKLLFYTLKHWRKRYTELAAEDFELQFRARKNVCKRHTKGFQNKVLKLWEEKQIAFEEKYKVSLH